MSSLSNVTVGVIGSGTHEHAPFAAEVGALLASLGVNLLTGGGGGVMTSVSRAYVETERTRGICIGIIPCASDAERSTPRAGYPNVFVELPIYTHLPYSGHRGKDDLSRNHINVLSCSAIVALPGEAGTIVEVSLALDYGRPVIAYSPDTRLVDAFPRAVVRVSTLADVRVFLQRHLAGMT